MKSRDKQLRRLVRFIDEVKKGRYPNSSSFAAKLKQLDEANNTDLAVCSKTIKRDIEYLRNTIGAPIEYDPSEHGFFLYVKDWTFPEIALSGDELFAEMFTRQISMENVLPSLKEHLETGLDVQMTVGASDNLNTSALNSVICVTDKKVRVDDKISEQITDAWKNCYTVEATYAKSSKDISLRKLDIHALFLSEKSWYCRAFCHERQDFRSFALHKFQKIEKTVDRFVRSTDVVKALKEGRIFDYKTLPEVTVSCDPEIAEYIADREWFANQKMTSESNGSLTVTFTDIPGQAIKSWIMSFSGQVSVTAPQELKEEIYSAAQKLMQKHQDR